MEETQHVSTRRSLRHARRVVVKAGTPALTHVDGNIALGRIGSLVEQIAVMRQEGREVVLFTSGAISTGQHRMRRSMTLSRSIRDSVAGGEQYIDQSSAAAVGQSLLIHMYENLFSKYNMTCAQVLVTEDDLNDSELLSQICDMTMELLSLGVVPILNENDAVTARLAPVYDEKTSEVRWDNDVLASTLSQALRADLLIMLTDMDSLYTRETSEDEPKRLPLYVTGSEYSLSLTGLVVDQLLSDGGRGRFSGRTRMSEMGLRALVSATTSAVDNGVRAAVVTTAHQPLSLLKVMRGDDVGTLFVTAAVRSKL